MRLVRMGITIQVLNNFDYAWKNNRFDLSFLMTSITWFRRPSNITNAISDKRVKKMKLSIFWGL